MYFDTHVHYNLSPLVQSWQKYWQEAQEAGVSKSLIVGADLATSKLGVEMAKQDKNLFAAIGVHPDVFTKLVKDNLKISKDFNLIEAEIKKIIKELAELAKEANAIGEIGLDYFQIAQKGLKREWILKAQELAFNLQLDLAKTNNLPVVVHLRDNPGQVGAHMRALEILDTWKNKGGGNFVLHCLSGNREYVQKGLEVGAYFGVDGNVTYDEKILELVKLIPAEKLLIETDAPYLAPKPYEGQVCRPKFLVETGNYIVEQLEISLEQLYQNSERFLLQ